MVSQYSLIREAFGIARGDTEMVPQRAHLQALVQLLDVLKTAHEERLEVIAILMAERRRAERRYH